MTPRAVLRISAKRLGPNATRAANPSPAATIPPRESVAQSASTTAGSAATANPRPRRLDPVAPIQPSRTTAVAIAAASPFQ